MNDEHTTSGHGFADAEPDDQPVPQPPLPPTMADKRQLQIVGAWRAGARTRRQLREAIDAIDAAASHGDRDDPPPTPRDGATQRRKKKGRDR